ncbi:MAG: MBL fold metallo-hydrolase [Myxococcota bacterium]|nr:MBL fold metallo-hydrolase [Myxococcota bacterium]
MSSARRHRAACLFLIALAACTYPRDTDITPTQTPADPTSLRAPHRDDADRFFVPWARDPKSVWGIVRWYFFTRNPYDKGGSAEVPRIENDGTALAGFAETPTVTWVGHSTFAVHEGDDVFLTDPHFGSRALLPKRRSDPGIPIEAVPDDAFAVISHNHYDHLDAWTVDTLPPSIRWFVPLGLAEWFRDRGRHDVVELDWWETAEHGRWRITCLPSQHWSMRIEQGTNESLWCSWLLQSGSANYYFAGDTGYFHGFAEFGRQYGEIDVALLPIGAYEPRWFMRWQHMDPAEAYQAFLDLNARFMLSMHWGTFDLTDEPVDLPPTELDRVVSARGGDERVRSLAVGETWKLPERP